MNETMRPHLTPAGRSTRWLECVDAEACRARLDDCVCLYHRTSAEIAQDVLSHGFTGARFIGVSVPLLESPANAEKNLTGVTILEVTIDHRSRLMPYHKTLEDQWFSTWQVPASLINSHGQVRQLTEDEAHEAYIDVRTRAENATADQFFWEAQQEAEEAWETETISLEEAGLVDTSSSDELTSVGELLADEELHDEVIDGDEL
jgi:hypothetical protein